MFRRSICLVIIVTFIFSLVSPYKQAQAAESVLGLPQPGVMVNLSAAYEPVLIKGLKINPKNPLSLDFIINTGNSQLTAADPQLKTESEKLIKYFFAALTLPEQDVWVNLSPYEKNRIIPDATGQTEMGRDMLAQDYILKQITASLIYPEKGLGKDFWDRIYAQAQEQFGTTQIPVNTFNKVWIVADKASVYEAKDTVLVVDTHLKVMLEEDYMALNKHVQAKATANDAHALGSRIIRQIILPALEKEVNEGKNFANLRQIFHSIILAKWYKESLKTALLNQVYSNKNKITGVDVTDKTIKEKIYQQYLRAYKKGVFNYIKEDIDQTTQQPTPRKYFSGGLQIEPKISRANLAQLSSSVDEDNRIGAKYLLVGELATKSNAAMVTLHSPGYTLWMAERKKVYAELSDPTNDSVVASAIEEWAHYPSDKLPNNELKNRTYLFADIILNDTDKYGTLAKIAALKNIKIEKYNRSSYPLSLKTFTLEKIYRAINHAYQSSNKDIQAAANAANARIEAAAKRIDPAMISTSDEVYQEYVNEIKQFNIPENVKTKFIDINSLNRPIEELENLGIFDNLGNKERLLTRYFNGLIKLAYYVNAGFFVDESQKILDEKDFLYEQRKILDPIVKDIMNTSGDQNAAMNAILSDPNYIEYEGFIEYLKLPENIQKKFLSVNLAKRVVESSKKQKYFTDLNILAKLVQIGEADTEILDNETNLEKYWPWAEAVSFTALGKALKDGSVRKEIFKSGYTDPDVIRNVFAVEQILYSAKLREAFLHPDYDKHFEKDKFSGLSQSEREKKIRDQLQLAKLKNISAQIALVKGRFPDYLKNRQRIIGTLWDMKILLEHIENMSEELQQFPDFNQGLAKLKYYFQFDKNLFASIETHMDRLSALMAGTRELTSPIKAIKVSKMLNSFSAEQINDFYSLYRTISLKRLTKVITDNKLAGIVIAAKKSDGNIFKELTGAIKNGHITNNVNYKAYLEMIAFKPATIKEINASESGDKNAAMVVSSGKLNLTSRKPGKGKYNEVFYFEKGWELYVELDNKKDDTLVRLYKDGLVNHWEARLNYNGLAWTNYGNPDWKSAIKAINRWGKIVEDAAMNSSFEGTLDWKNSMHLMNGFIFIELNVENKSQEAFAKLLGVDTMKNEEYFVIVKTKEDELTPVYIGRTAKETSLNSALLSNEIEKKLSKNGIQGKLSPTILHFQIFDPLLLMGPSEKPLSFEIDRTKRVVSLKEIDSAMQAQTLQKSAPGGIDLNASKITMQRSGTGVDIQFDPAMIEQFKQGNFDGIVPVITSITPIADIYPLIGR